MTNPPEPIDNRKLATAIRFAFVCFVLVLSYLAIRGSLNIRNFGHIFQDMLGGKPLPLLTSTVLKNAPVFVALSIAFPVVAVATLFQRNIANSFYILGILCLVVLGQCILLFTALSGPLIEIIRQMGGNP